MKKLFMLFIALLLCSSAYGLNETADNGPQNITNCYMVGTTNVTSGNVVVLQTTSPTYPGREVTYSTTSGAGIYGIIVDTRNLTPENMIGGQNVRVLTYGYASKIKVSVPTTFRQVSSGVVGLVCSEIAGAAAIGSGAPRHGDTAPDVTSNVIALTASEAVGTQVLVDGFITW